MARIELSNIGGGGTTLSLTTTGTSGASTLAGSVLNIPVYQGQLTLTTTGTSGAATLVGDTLNIPQYSGGGTPAGSAGQVQFNSTPAGSFEASANLTWDNGATQLNIGSPSVPTGKLNVKGGGSSSSTVNLRLTNSGNTELLKVLDNGSTNIGTNFNWDNSNNRLTIGTFPQWSAADLVIDRASAATGVRIRSTQTNGESYIGLYNDVSTEYAALEFFGSTASATLKNKATFTAASSAGMDFILYSNSATSSFSIKSTTGLTERFTLIGSSGNVGISATSPSARLHIRGSNTSSGTNALLVQNSTPSDIYKIENNGKISYWATNTAAGTTGAQTINRPSGTVNFGIGAGSLVVTNSLCTTSSIVFATVRTNDATAYIKNVVPAAGSFTINLGANATAETSVGFFIIN